MEVMKDTSTRRQWLRRQRAKRNSCPQQLIQVGASTTIIGAINSLQDGRRPTLGGLRGGAKFGQPSSSIFFARIQAKPVPKCTRKGALPLRVSRRSFEDAVEMEGTQTGLLNSETAAAVQAQPSTPPRASYKMSWSSYHLLRPYKSSCALQTAATTLTGNLAPLEDELTATTHTRQCCGTPVAPGTHSLFGGMGIPEGQTCSEHEKNTAPGLSRR